MKKKIDERMKKMIDFFVVFFWLFLVVAVYVKQRTKHSGFFAVYGGILSKISINGGNIE